MDGHINGEVAAAGELRMKLFCAVETSLNAGWNVAQHMEMIPANAVSSASHTHRRAALRKEAREMRDRDLLGKLAGQGLGKGRSHLTSESPLRSPSHHKRTPLQSACVRQRVLLALLLYGQAWSRERRDGGGSS